MSSNSTRFLLVGLGNPGPQYENTRHNIGFKVIDALAEKWRVDGFSKKFKGLFVESSWKDHKVLLLKPQTYMNLSGESVREAAQFFKIPVESHVVVVSDDLDLPPGSIRLRKSGGSGGHNGLKSITEMLGTEGYPRLRLGIGRSSTVPTENYVLMSIPETEKKLYAQAVLTASEAIETLLTEGIEKAMSLFNKRSPNEP
ncbi:aminoacyl-tRNA hydrolase [bacterium]|nr:aminoacyl-tRNA hydrolase [bacterium]